MAWGLNCTCGALGCDSSWGLKLGVGDPPVVQLGGPTKELLSWVTEQGSQRQVRGFSCSWEGSRWGSFWAQVAWTFRARPETGGSCDTALWPHMASAPVGLLEWNSALGHAGDRALVGVEMGLQGTARGTLPFPSRPRSHRHSGKIF